MNALPKVFVFDDQPDARAAMCESLSDAGFEPAPLEHVGTLDEVMNLEGYAAIFDQNLSPRNYATFSGAEAVSRLYQRHFPAVLVTAVSDYEIDNVRPYRAFVPVLLHHEDLDTPTLRQALEEASAEVQGNVKPTRRPHRALVRVDSVSQDAGKESAYVIVPAWNAQQKIRMPKQVFPDDLWRQFEPNFRFFATVNIGAERHEELFIQALDEPA